MSPTTPVATRAAEKPKAPYHHGDLPAALVAAAEALLAERGVEGFTLRECARRVGVSPAAPAHHFGNAAGLLATIARMGYDELSDAMEAALVDAGPEPGRRLEAIATAYVGFALRRPERFRVTFGSAVPGRAREGALRASGHRAFDILQREVARAVPGSASLRAATVRAWSLMHGLAMLLLDDRLTMLLDEADPERDRHVLVAEVAALIAPAP